MTASAWPPRAIRLVTSVCGLGWLPGAPGTWCSVAAIGLGYLLHRMGGLPALLLATVIASALGFGIIRHALLEGEDPDPGEIVIDELVGQWIALLPLSAGLWHAGVPGHVFPWPGLVGAFLLFRLFDIWKPGPVGWADGLGGTLGVMLDDVLAGLMAAAGVAIAAAIAHGVLM